MQVQTNCLSKPVQGVNSQNNVKNGKKRGRPQLPFVAKPTPSMLVLQALDKNIFLDFAALQLQTKLSEERLGLALTNLIISTDQVVTYHRNNTRFYRLNK